MLDSARRTAVAKWEARFEVRAAPEKAWKTVPRLFNGDFMGMNGDLPSGKRLHSCGESPFFVGKSDTNGNVQ